MALTDRLMDDLRMSLPGAVDAAIQRALWSVINTACRDGWVWRETTGVAITTTSLQYDVTPAGTDVVQVISVTHPTMNVSDAVVEFGKLFLTILPTVAEAADPVLIALVLAPALDAVDPEGLIPSDMWSTYYDLWKNGVMGAMMAQPAKPYTNPTLAAFYARSFKRDLGQARLRVRTGGVSGAQMWRFPRWAS